MSHSVIRHKNPRGKLTHPSQGQELELAGRFTDQTKNSISSKKCEKVLYVTVIYTTDLDQKIPSFPNCDNYRIHRASNPNPLSDDMRTNDNELHQ